MLLMLIALGTIPEIALFAPYFWKNRPWVAAFNILALVFASSAVIFWQLNVFSVLLLEVSIFRLVNMSRVIESRMNERYMFSVVRRASFYLLSSQVMLMLGWFVYRQYNWHLEPFVLVGSLAILQAIVAVLVLAITTRNVLKTTYTLPDQHYSDNDLPTVTVAIPARNETPDLSQCLETVIGSDYPKIEVLVLDDCSQDQTSDVVKTFAQAGVRFVHGHEPKSNWLAKNQAYDQLAKEASGEFILFCGVDTRLAKGTIRALVTTALVKNKSMISVLPKHHSVGTFSSLIQPMRYWWELALPRRFFNRPAVLSTCWLINKRVLEQSGGFGAVHNAVLPEAYLAKILIKNDSYSFIRNSGGLGAVSVKQFKDQFERAIRLRYPEVHKRLELVLLLADLELLFLIGPLVFFAYGLVASDNLILILASISTACLLATHGLILKISSQPYRLFQPLNYPLMVGVEFCLGLASMIKYEFSEVDWKGRNICLPVMHAIPYEKAFIPDLERKMKKSSRY